METQHKIISLKELDKIIAAKTEAMLNYAPFLVMRKTHLAIIEEIENILETYSCSCNSKQLIELKQKLTGETHE
jgi:hypothetical protein